MIYTDQQRSQARTLYGIGRTPQREDSYSQGKYTLRQISERTGIPVRSVYKVVTGK